jgi:hypothetical protein
LKYIVNLYDTLEQLQQRKAMYLGNDYNFKCLDSFITGFTFAAQSHQLEKPGYNNFTYFSTWLLGHLPAHYGLSGGWHWQISNKNPQDDGKAFEEFFYFLDVFKRSALSARIITVDPAALAFSSNSSVKRYSLTPGKDQHPISKPDSIRKVNIFGSTTLWIEFLDKEHQILTEQWYLTEQEADERLRQEFGEFEGEWVEEITVTNQRR